MRTPLVGLVTSVLLTGCHPPKSPAPTSAEEVHIASATATASATSGPVTTSRLWRHDGPEIVGVVGDFAYHWDSAGDGEIVATSVRTGAKTSSRPIHGNNINGRPELWSAVPGGFVTSWDGPAYVTEDRGRLTLAWQGGAPRWSTTVVADDVALSWQHEPTPQIVAHEMPSGGEIWRTAVAPGANGFELTVNGDQLLVVWQQYSPTAPTPTITMAQRVMAVSLADGKPRWTRDFSVATGGISANGDTLVVAEETDIVFMDGPSGREIRRAATGHNGHIYPTFATDATKVYAALVDAVTAYDATTGAVAWRAPIRVGSGAELVVGDDALFVTTEYGSVIALAPQTGVRKWEVGLGMVPRRLAVTPSAFVAMGGGAAGFTLPPNFRTERATIRGHVEIRCRQFGVGKLMVGDQRVTPGADGDFVATVNMAGAVLVGARWAGLSRDGAPSSASVVLDGRGNYDVGTITLDGCDR